jgi:hypothetical protein
MTTAAISPITATTQIIQIPAVDVDIESPFTSLPAPTDPAAAMDAHQWFRITVLTRSFAVGSSG